MKYTKTLSIVYLVMVLCLVVACASSTTQDMSEEITDSNQVDALVDEKPIADSDRINWQNWYLSVPINAGNGKATSINYQRIINDELTAQESKYFYENEDGSYTLWTKFTGYTTSGKSALGDKYCRTELREYWRGNQDTNDNWSMTTGTHILETTLEVNFVEGNGRTIVAQIHGKESDGVEGNPATVKIRWNDGIIQIDHYTKPSNNDSWTSKYDNKVDFGKVENEIFTFKLKIENGKLYCALICEAKNINRDYEEIYDYAGNGYQHKNYFKTGNYFGWHDDYEKAAQVILHKVVTKHDL